MGITSCFPLWSGGGPGPFTNGMALWSGTSFAAPVVAGRIAALMSAKDMSARYAAMELLDPTGASSIMPGTKNVDSPSGANDTDADAVGGYIWDAALRGGKSVRNYGFFLDQAFYLQATQTDPTTVRRKIS